MRDAAGGAARRAWTAPGPVRWIVRTLEAEGYETWAVGGAVRDAVLGAPGGDWDLATRARPEEVRRIFRRTVPVGVEHGTVGVLARDGVMYEVTTFRRDVETFGRHAVVAFADSLEEDLERRDFTINALAWHPLRDTLFDPHGGVEDLAAGRLRTVGLPQDRFAEDYLRVLRALRFAGRFHLEIEADTWTALEAAAHHLDVLSPERVREELWKVLSGTERPRRTLDLYGRAGVFRELMPEVERVAAPPDRDGVWDLALATVDRIPRTRPGLRLAGLLLDIGRPGPSPQDPELPGESGPWPDEAGRRGMARAAALLTRLRHSNAQVSRIAALVGAGTDLPEGGAPGVEVRRWLARVGVGPMADVIRLAGARARATEASHGDPEGPGARVLAVAAAARRMRRELSGHPPLSVGDLALGGRDLIGLGLRPGPHFGTILEGLLDRVLEDPSLNTREGLLPVARELALHLEPEAGS